MSGSRSNPVERRLAEQHLGDRLAALVDGELGHDARERVLAHLATCPKCKTEADAQRRLKSVFAEAAPPPPPSESFLARLQGLPGGGSEPPSGPKPPGSGGFATADTESGLPPTGVFGVRPETFGYAPSGAHAAVLPGSGRGFRIHDVDRYDVGRHEAERSSLWRGRRFAFAAAGAVSLAAIALGGVTTGIPADPGEPRAGSGSSNSSGSNNSGSNSSASPLRSQGSGATTAPDSVRRRGSGPLTAQGPRPGVLAAPVAPTQAAGPLLPGVTARGPRVQQPERHEVTAPMLTGAAIMSPFIRPVSPVGSASPPGDAAADGGADPVSTAAASPVDGTLEGTSQIR
ncbi:anti-sigma factor family protein [Streptomyces sp. NPDC055189]